ncbi:MAG: chemotaxis protein CheW [Armatimonadota bacterium]
MSTLQETVVTTGVDEQLVIFTLNQELYGINIEAVNTIIRLPEITSTPHAAPCVKGVMNFRGTIVPIVNLRLRLGLQETEATKATRVIVVDQFGMLVGLIVDTVTETLHLPVAAIEPLSEMAQSIDSRYVRGVGKQDHRLIILLSLEEVIERPQALHELSSQAVNTN